MHYLCESTVSLKHIMPILCCNAVTNWIHSLAFETRLVMVEFCFYSDSSATFHFILSGSLKTFTIVGIYCIFFYFAPDAPIGSCSFGLSLLCISSVVPILCSLCFFSQYFFLFPVISSSSSPLFTYPFVPHLTLASEEACFPQAKAGIIEHSVVAEEWDVLL